MGISERKRRNPCRPAELLSATLSADCEGPGFDGSDMAYAVPYVRQSPGNGRRDRSNDCNPSETQWDGIGATLGTSEPFISAGGSREGFDVREDDKGAGEGAGKKGTRAGRKAGGRTVWDRGRYSNRTWNRKIERCERKPMN